MGLGFTGYVLPVMPGTIFMILAALCFLRSSDKFYNKIINNPSFGDSVKNYVEEGYINKKSKYTILISMWSATLVSIFFFVPPFYLILSALLMSTIGSVVVLRAKH